MDTFIKPTTSVRFADSGGIKTVLQELDVKRAAPDDDKPDVRLPDGAYRIVMHCSRGVYAKPSNKKQS